MNIYVFFEIVTKFRRQYIYMQLKRYIYVNCFQYTYCLSTYIQHYILCTYLHVSYRIFQQAPLSNNVDWRLTENTPISVQRSECQPNRRVSLRYSKHTLQHTANTATQATATATHSTAYYTTHTCTYIQFIYMLKFVSLRNKTKIAKQKTTDNIFVC